MKQLKSYHVLLFLLGLFLVLAPLVFFTPKDGWKVGNSSIKFLTKEKFLHPIKAENKDITKIVSKVDTALVEENLRKYQNAGSGNLGAPKGGALNMNSETHLILDENGLANLHDFFSKMDQVSKNKTKVSIFHYGDSQIEGDRMTNIIRERIQRQFGGFGPGLIPAKNIYVTRSYEQKTSESMQRYMNYARTGLISNKYGALCSVARFTQEMTPSIEEQKSMSDKSGWIEFSPNTRALSRSRLFNTVVLHYSDCIAKTRVKIYKDNNLIHEDTLVTDSLYHSLTLKFDSTPGKLRYEFIGKVSPNIYGFSLDGDYGVQVTNSGMRGSSGYVYSKMDYSDTRKMYRELNTQLIILQFGGNAVPYFTDSSSVTKYANKIKRQISAAQSLMPGKAVIVIGPSDMSTLVDGVQLTYEFLPFCVEEMKRVTIESGAAYWDLYDAMGGKNSMPSWVNAGLAGHDYIHFSVDGAKVASKMFYDAFISEFAKWKQNN